MRKYNIALSRHWSIIFIAYCAVWLSPFLFSVSHNDYEVFLSKCMNCRNAFPRQWTCFLLHLPLSVATLHLTFSQIPTQPLTPSKEVWNGGLPRQLQEGSLQHCLYLVYRYFWWEIYFYISGLQKTNFPAPPSSAPTFVWIWSLPPAQPSVLC